MKILILGGSSFIGFNLAKSLEDYEVFATYSSNKINLIGKKFIKFDFKKDSLRDIVEGIKPDLIIDCIAYSNIKFCEDNKEEAYDLNVNLTKKVTELCRELETKLIYLSSVDVFNGMNRLIKENDKAIPINYYGKTKLESEKIIKDRLEDYTIIRTSVVFGWNEPFQHPTFLSLVYNKLVNEEKVEMFTDMFRTPAYLNDLSKAVLKIIEKDSKGIYHISNEKICIFDFAQLIAETFNLEKSLIIGCKSHSFDKKFKPRRLCLDNSKAKEDLNITPLSIKEALSELKNEIGK